jgi:hypothetical protein
VPAPAPAESYKPPAWSESPGTAFFLEVLKNGQIVEKIDVSEKAFYTFGRDKGSVDVGLQHGSISRLHAVLQHGQGDKIFVFDTSTHGTSCNKKRVPRQAYFRVNVGDVLKFGESSRLYIVGGPEDFQPAEYESENLKKLRLKLEARAEKEEGQKKKAPSIEHGYATWGFDEDAEEEEDEEEDEEEEEGGGGEGGGGKGRGRDELPEYLRLQRAKDAGKGLEAHGFGVSINKQEVDEKDKALFEKLEKKVGKMENLQQEKERIFAKEDAQGGLTDGQQQQAQRNEKRLNELQAQIEELEHQIRQREQTRLGTQNAKEMKELGKKKAAAGGGDGGGGGDPRDYGEDDDFYDRTTQVPRLLLEYPFTYPYPLTTSTTVPRRSRPD